MFYDIGHTEYYSAGSQVTQTPPQTLSLNVFCGKNQNHFLFWENTNMRQCLVKVAAVFISQSSSESSLLFSAAQPFLFLCTHFSFNFSFHSIYLHTCKCENQCLHNLNQLKLIKANCDFSGWAEMENSPCPNAHTPLQSPACHTAG